MNIFKDIKLKTLIQLKQITLQISIINCLDIGPGKKDSPVVATQLVVPTQLSEVS